MSDQLRKAIMRAEHAEAERDRWVQIVAHADRDKRELRGEIATLRAALLHALEWLEEEGCDCGTDEPGTCALCETKAALGSRREVIDNEYDPKRDGRMVLGWTVAAGLTVLVVVGMILYEVSR